MESGKRCPAHSKERDAPLDSLMECDQFLRAVLPVGWELDDLIDYALWYDRPDDCPVKEDS